MCTHNNREPNVRFRNGIKGVLLAALLSTTLTGCLHDADDTIVLPLPDGKIPFSVIDSDLQDSLRIHGFDINEGTNPPNIEGTYLMSPMILDYASDSSTLTFVDLTLKYSDQIERGLVTYTETQRTHVEQIGVAGRSIEANVIGDGDRFTAYCYQNVTQPESGTQQWRVKLATVVSGSISASGISNCQYAIIYLEREINDSSYQQTIPGEGTYRLFHDGDMLAARLSGSSKID